MSSRRHKVIMGVDVDKARATMSRFLADVRQKIGNLSKESKTLTEEQQKKNEEMRKQISSMVTTSRRVAQIGFATSQAFGFAIDQTLQLGIEAGMLLVESYVKASEFAATEAGLGNPLALLRVEANIAAATSMGMTIIALQQNRTKLSQRMNAATGAFRLLTF